VLLDERKGKSAAACYDINENHVSNLVGYSYIAAQRPLQQTIHDFKPPKMLTRARISTVVTACQDVEGGKDKCFKYWTDSADGKWQATRSN
jgi:protein tyrosine phosphatase